LTRGFLPAAIGVSTIVTSTNASAFGASVFNINNLFYYQKVGRSIMSGYSADTFYEFTCESDYSAGYTYNCVQMWKNIIYKNSAGDITSHSRSLVYKAFGRLHADIVIYDSAGNQLAETDLSNLGGNPACGGRRLAIDNDLVNRVIRGTLGNQSYSLGLVRRLGDNGEVDIAHVTFYTRDPSDGTPQTWTTTIMASNLVNHEYWYTTPQWANAPLVPAVQAAFNAAVAAHDAIVAVPEPFTTSYCTGIMSVIGIATTKGSISLPWVLLTGAFCMARSAQDSVNLRAANYSTAIANLVVAMQNVANPWNIVRDDNCGDNVRRF
jgi:hypothetical protein